MFAWSCSIRNYNLTSSRIYTCISSIRIYDRDIYIVFGSRSTIYSIITKYIYSTSCLRNCYIIIWSQYKVSWHYYFHSTCLTVVCLTFFTYFVSYCIFAWCYSIRNYNLTSSRIYICISSIMIYYRDIYIVFGSRSTIYSIITNYIYCSSCLRYRLVRIWVQNNVRWHYYLKCICLAISSASLFTYFISNNMFAWCKTSWYINLTCSRIYSSTCSIIVCYRNIYIVFGSRISTYSNIVQYIHSSTCLRYSLSSWINYYWIGTYCYSSCRLLTRLSSSWSFITYSILYSIST